MNIMANKVVKFKVIFVNQKKGDGTTFKKMKTILKVDGKDKWIDIKFDDAVNVKLFKNENQLVTANADDVSKPKTLTPYVSKKDGKTKYPYVFVKNIQGFEKLQYQGNNEPSIDYEFSIDEENDTMPFSGGVDGNQE